MNIYFVTFGEAFFARFIPRLLPAEIYRIVCRILLHRLRLAGLVIIVIFADESHSDSVVGGSCPCAGAKRVVHFFALDPQTLFVAEIVVWLVRIPFNLPVRNSAKHRFDRALRKRTVSVVNRVQLFHADPKGL